MKSHTYNTKLSQIQNIYSSEQYSEIMGWANCRFEKDEGCKNTGSAHYVVKIHNSDKLLNIPEMWKHYMIDHLIQPTPEEKQLIMSTDIEHITSQRIQTRSINVEHTMNFRDNEYPILYVERLGPNQYTHQIGTIQDFEFISKLEQILKDNKPIIMQTLNYTRKI